MNNGITGVCAQRSHVLCQQGIDDSTVWVLNLASHHTESRATHGDHAGLNRSGHDT